MCISGNLPDTLLLFEQICITIFVCSHGGNTCEPPPDKGLLLSSRVDFTIPSPFAREHLSGGESAASTAQATFPAYSAAVKK